MSIYTAGNYDVYVCVRANIVCNIGLYFIVNTEIIHRQNGNGRSMLKYFCAYSPSVNEYTECVLSFISHDTNLSYSARYTVSVQFYFKHSYA